MMKDSDMGSSKFKTAGGQGPVGPDIDNVNEEIFDEVEDLMDAQGIMGKKGGPLANSNDAALISGGISSSGANAIDQSIDTLQLDQYDYVEPVRLNNP